MHFWHPAALDWTNVHIECACLPLGLYNHVANRMWTQCLLPQCRYDSVANWLHNMATTFAHLLCQMPYHVCCHIMSVAMLQSVQCGIFIVLRTHFFRFATLAFCDMWTHCACFFRLSIQMWFHCFFVLSWANMATSTLCFQVHLRYVHFFLVDSVTNVLTCHVYVLDNHMGGRGARACSCYIFAFTSWHFLLGGKCLPLAFTFPPLTIWSVPTSAEWLVAIIKMMTMISWIHHSVTGQLDGEKRATR